MKKHFLVFLISLLCITSILSPIGIQAQEDVWKGVGTLPTPMSGFALGIHEGTIYVIGDIEFSTNVYYALILNDGTIGEWHLTTPLPHGRGWKSQQEAIVYNNRIYVIGGAGIDPPSSRIEKNTVWYAEITSDGSLGDWISTTPLPDYINSHITVLWEDIIYVIGGWTGYSWLNTVYYANINDDGSISAWSQTSSLPEPRGHDQAGAAHNGIIYQLGGQYPSGVFHDTVYSGQIEPNGQVSTWAMTTSIPGSLGQHAVSILGDKMFITGGYFSGSYSNTVFSTQIQSDGSLGVWSAEPSLPEIRKEHSSVAYNERIYVLGGRNENNEALDSIYCLEKTTNIPDNEPPIITIIHPEPYGVYAKGFELDFSATDDLSGVEYLIGYLTNTAGITLEVGDNYVPIPGVYTLTVEAIDYAGNMATSEPLFFVVYDPEGGFATGGGWYIPEEELIGSEWTKYENNPLVEIPADMGYGHSIIFDGSQYLMYYVTETKPRSFDLATSEDGIIWEDYGTVLTPGPDSWDALAINFPSVLFDGSMYKMWYRGYPDHGEAQRYGLATSLDGITWTKQGVVFEPSWTSSDWDYWQIGGATVIFDEDEYKMYYHAGHPNVNGIGLATSEDGITWTKEGQIFAVGDGGLDDLIMTIGGSAVIKDGGIYKMWYSGLDKPTSVGGRFRILYSTSTDGFSWSDSISVLESEVDTWEWPYVSFATLLNEGDNYKMWYEAGSDYPYANGLATVDCSYYRANFGFVAKYKKGVSTGNIEFQYQFAGINLKSQTIDWLTISVKKAIFQGTGTINNEGFYTFRVITTDNGEPGIEDHFNIKIWEGSDTEADPIHKSKNILSGGNIKIHKK